VESAFEEMRGDAGQAMRDRRCGPRRDKTEAGQTEAGQTEAGQEGVKKLTTTRGCFWTGNVARLQV